MPIIATYKTRSGLDAFVVHQDSSGYRYIGKHGAGCSKELKGIAKTIKSAMQSRKGITHHSGQDITLLI